MLAVRGRIAADLKFRSSWNSRSERSMAFAWQLHKEVQVTVTLVSNLLTNR